VGLGERASDKVKTYSLGMKQRLSLAAALLTDPELLILDEPTNGMDPNGMMEVRELIRELGREGKTVFLSSHLLHEVQQVCSRVAIIKKGEVLAQGRVDELLRRGRVLQIRVPEPERAAAVVRGLEWVSSVDVEGGMLLVEVHPERAQDVSAALAQRGIYPSEMRFREESLESFFREVTREEG
jgi:ABC-2 type transport system ATP-binding protein